MTDGNRTDDICSIPPPDVAARIKVIDLLVPLACGGKAAMFGGRGLGKTALVYDPILTVRSCAAARVQGADGAVRPG